MLDTTAHRRQWDAYWTETRALDRQSPEEARPVWDANAEYSAALDLPRFKPHVDDGLPLIDFGCGNGTQTAFLATAFARVIGTDVAAAAVELAAETNPAGNARYEVLDALNKDAVHRFHDRVGDANLYLRTVIHQFSPEQRAMLGENLRCLLGACGTLYLVELGPEAHAYFEGWIAANGMPHKLQRIIEKGIVPGPVSRDDVDRMFPATEYEVLSEGECTNPGMRLRTAKSDAEGSDGYVWEPPMYFAVVRARSH